MAERIEEKDGRIGSSVRGKYQFSPYRLALGIIIDVLPNGSYGIWDKNGVTVVKLSCGQIVVTPAEDWQDSHD